MKHEKITLDYGVLSEDLEDQVNKYGFTLGKSKDRLQGCNDAIFRLRVVLGVPDSIHVNLLNRLNKAVVKALRPLQEK